MKMAMKNHELRIGRELSKLSEKLTHPSGRSQKASKAEVEQAKRDAEESSKALEESRRKQDAQIAEQRARAKALRKDGDHGKASRIEHNCKQLEEALYVLRLETEIALLKGKTKHLEADTASINRLTDEMQKGTRKRGALPAEREEEVERQHRAKMRALEEQRVKLEIEGTQVAINELKE